MLLHVGDLEEAHDTLLRNPLIKSDPWLISAEIALASIKGHTSRHMKLGRRMVDKDAFAPLHLSELQSSIATNDANAGNKRKASRLCEKSLRSPAENSVAQVAWLRRKQLIQLTPALERNTVTSSEANAWTAAAASKWDVAITEAKRWQVDQPFSSRPAILSGGIAATVLEDFEEAENCSRAALLSNRDDPSIVNNLAFSLAKQDRPIDALDLIATIDGNSCTDTQKICLLATTGLSLFRKKNFYEGRKRYHDAIRAATLLGMKHLAAVASVYLAIEESICDTTVAPQAITVALDSIRHIAPDMQQVFRDKLMRLN